MSTTVHIRLLSTAEKIDGLFSFYVLRVAVNTTNLRVAENRILCSCQSRYESHGIQAIFSEKSILRCINLIWKVFK